MLNPMQDFEVMMFDPMAKRTSTVTLRPKNSTSEQVTTDLDGRRIATISYTRAGQSYTTAL